MAAGPTTIPLSEVIGGLSYALDLTEGEPPGHATRSCVIGMRLAEVLELGAAARSDLFYALLLKDAGCTANAARMAALFGADEHELKSTAKRVDWSSSFSAFVWSVRSVAGSSVRERIDRLLEIKNEGEVTRSLMQARCDRGAAIARMIGLSDRTAEAIRALDEHWDGRGQPRGLACEEIPLFGRILCLAQTVEIFHGAGGVDAAYDVAERRSGGWFDPELVDALGAFRHDDTFWASLAGEPDLARWEPADRVLTVDAEGELRLATAFAAVVDAKSPWTYHHSDRTSLIATNMGAALGFAIEELGALRRVALLHDIGKLAISNRILDKPSKLTPAEFARVREHPLFTRWVLERVSCFADLAPIAAAHHERLDGGGYPHGLRADDLTMPMRVLAVADVYEALTARRPYREALAEEDALDLMRLDVPARLDAEAFRALEIVVEAA
jgi:HD-GYP domain-containing protein (c-di-GMP phosphodiesterase class II)